MAMRVTGMYSGLDTETIIQELVAVKQTKVDDASKTKTKHEWKQEAWKDLNTKLKNFQTKYVANMRFSSAFIKKTTKVSNSDAVSIITGEKAVNGVQELQVNKLAKTAYLTGAKIESSTGNKLNALSRIANVNPDFAGGTITVKTGGKATEINVAADATISDVLTQLKNCGLNASFDENNQRLFVSAKESGAESNFTLNSTGGVLKSLGLSLSAGATKINGQDAEITLNGANFTSSSNVFEINGLTFTALKETAEGETVTVTTENDTDGIYDMVKEFLIEYNALINEMDKLYNAESAKGYEPLSDEEKEAISETEAEEWEKKIKDALLRRDSNLSSVSSMMKDVMSSGIEIGGETLYLTDFGIDTLGYFEAEDNERNAYHIAGDADDAATSGKADRLKGLIANNPDKVVNFFTKLAQNMYSKMDSMTKSVAGYRTYGSFYDDKKMQSDFDDYTAKIKELEEKLADYEDKWYAKFSAMETALAKMQSNSSAVTSLIGG